MKLSLVVNEGVHKGKTISINLAQFVIGRDPQCQLRPSSPMISKRHCALLIRDDKAFVRDFDSTNGTTVNEEEVKGERELHDQDNLKVGPLAFVVRIQISTPVDKPTPLPPAKTPPPKSKDHVDEESIAAMLLEMQDEGPIGNVGEDGIPTGSTVMEIPALGEKEPEAKDEKPGSKPPPAKQEPPPSTSNAAKAILDKYSRRRRTL